MIETESIIFFSVAVKKHYDQSDLEKNEFTLTMVPEVPSWKDQEWMAAGYRQGRCWSRKPKAHIVSYNHTLRE